MKVPKTKTKNASAKNVQFDFSFSTKKQNKWDKTYENDSEVMHEIFMQLRRGFAPETMIVAMRDFIVEMMLENGYDNGKSVKVEIAEKKQEHTFVKIGSKQAQYRFQASIDGDYAGRKLIVEELF